MKGNISRRGVVKGTAWAVPVVLASTAVPALAASHCQPGVVVPTPTNTSTDGSSLTHTFTATDKAQSLTFTITGGGGGYGGGGSGSVTTAAGYATDQRWAGEYTYVNGEYQAGDYWSPVGSAAFSGAGGAGGSYLDNQRVYSGYIATGTSPGVAGSRVNGTSFATVGEIQD
ncbi:hypothetical protein [Rothia aeria]|uniref:hypothetical protein n=1 Tax=Rothia aeria TaxID=172042 RepID=UPI00244B6AAF|nr:hypothetical protein [Rothia aeria]